MNSQTKEQPPQPNTNNKTTTEANRQWPCNTAPKKTTIKKTNQHQPSEHAPYADNA